MSAERCAKPGSSAPSPAAFSDHSWRLQERAAIAGEGAGGPGLAGRKNADTHCLYPRFSRQKPRRIKENGKINPTGLKAGYTAFALTREDFEELRNFEM